MSLNTVKTILGFLRTLLQKYLPLNVRYESLTDIYNYLPIDERLSTSGQPTKCQFRTIKQQGYTVVINLAPENAENAIENEAGLLRQLGLIYRHLPVDFYNPTEADFVSFVKHMQELQHEKIWLHCAANMRVSAFVYRYRCGILREDPLVAGRDLEKIWQPLGVWREFTFAPLDELQT